MNYNYSQQQPQMQTPYGSQYNNFKVNNYPTIPIVRPVSSIEEVRASPIEFDGSIFYFPDIANKKIYTKFVNMEGQVNINLYELKEINTPDQTIDSSAFITRTEFEETINSLKQLLQQEISQSAVQPQQANFKF